MLGWPLLGFFFSGFLFSFLLLGESVWQVIYKEYIHCFGAQIFPVVWPARVPMSSCSAACTYLCATGLSHRSRSVTEI